MNEFIIKEYLLKKGFKMNRKGFFMISDAVTMYDPSIKLDGLYADLAKKHGIEARKLEGVIFYAKKGSYFNDVGSIEMLSAIQKEVKELLVEKES